MKVYILFHADIEDDRYVRGVYLRHEDAEAMVGVNEDRGYGMRRHGDWCCGVDEEEVLEEAAMPQFGPFARDLIDPNATGLIRFDFEEMLMRTITAPTPLWDRGRASEFSTGQIEAAADQIAAAFRKVVEEGA